jgi:hypothetical protein
MAVAAALALGAAAGARADAAWEFTPTLQAGYIYDDNYRLATPGGEIDVAGPMADAALEMHAKTERNEFSFTPRVRATYFPNEQDLDSTDYFATTNFSHQGQRVNFHIGADGQKQDVINSEQPDTGIDSGLGEVDIGDSGRVLVKNRRTRFDVTPGVDFELSPRKQIELAAEYVDVSYDDQIPGAQVDFRLAQGTAALVSRLSERSTLTTRIRGAQFDIDGQGTTDSYGAELEWGMRTATATQSFLRVGAQQVNLPTGEDVTAWVAGGGVDWVAGRNEIFADIARSVAPSSAGAVITRDQLRLSLTRAMTPRLSLLAGLRGIHDDSVDNAEFFTTRSYATADLGLQWRWQEEFSLRAEYDYTWQKYQGAADKATSNGAMLSFVYQPLQRLRPRND